MLTKLLVLYTIAVALASTQHYDEKEFLRRLKLHQQNIDHNPSLCM